MRLSLSFALVFWATIAPAQTSTPDAFLATNGLAKTIIQLATDPAVNGFEIGMLQTLRAVEKTLQARYEYGLGDRVSGLPLLRLDAKGMRNPAPKASTPGTLSMIMDGFVDDMAQARTTLTMAETAGIAPFNMVLQDIWFDVNANGTREEAESAFAILGPMVLGRRQYRNMLKSDEAIPQLAIRFDNADHAWLMAYTNMLSGVGNLFMAFDPEPVLRDLANKRASLAEAPTIQNFYDPDVIAAEITTLKAELEVTKRQNDDLREQINTAQGELQRLKAEEKETRDVVGKALIQADIVQVNSKIKVLRDEQRTVSQARRFIGNEIRAAELKLPSGSSRIRRSLKEQVATIDAIYVTIEALAQDPDPARIRAAYDNLRAMIHHNRIFWERLADETDNENEWIPNASQQSAMPFDIPPQLAEGWQNILSDVEATLEGKLLINHPLLPEGYGLSLPAYVANPSGLDLIGWIHGVDAYPYAAKGPRLTGQSWQAFRRLTRGNAGGFALFLN
ncbi:hypothetical protein [Profundibacter sp.]